MYSNSNRSIPSGYNVVMSTISFNKDTNLWNMSTGLNLVDGYSSWQSSPIALSGNSGEKLVGVRFSFNPSIDGGFYSQHTLNLSAFEMRIETPDSSQIFAISPTAVPVYAYAAYTGSYEFQIYDGSVGYERWIYDNSFELTKPVQVNASNFGQIHSQSSFGFDYSLSAPSISSADILNNTGYRNNIANYIEFAETTIDNVDFVSIEDFPTDNIRIVNDSVNIFVLYSIDDVSFEPYATWMGDIEIPYTLDGCVFRAVLNPSPYCGNLSSVNVNGIDYLDDEKSGLSFISNGFYTLKSSIGSSLSNVVTNATDNANRIIQNTTQKVDEVKQGVTEVKDSVVETKNSILDLPNKIKEMLIGLIVPPEEDINNKFADFETLLSDRFGLIYQSADIIHDFADSFNTSAVTVVSDRSNANTVNFPQVTVSLAGSEFVFGGYDVQLIPEGFEFLQSAVKTAISLVCTILFINMCKNKLEAILK